MIYDVLTALAIAFIIVLAIVTMAIPPNEEAQIQYNIGKPQ